MCAENLKVHKGNEVIVSKSLTYTSDPVWVEVDQRIGPQKAPIL